MSEKMRPIPFDRLMNWILTEYHQQKSIFGIYKLIHRDSEEARPIFEEKIETPFGPAAGPNTQLAQNIIASYVAGARFFELKTVQVIDGEDLAKCVNRPCILAQDECYNCEWSTELYVPQAFDEYVKGWFACKLLAKELGLGDPEGFVFNMSVGYDLEGIKSPKVDKYITEMQDASDTQSWQACKDWALSHLDRFEHVDQAFVESISPVISKSITESTLHGCPPDEIERIASYLISEKGLHTYIKCNPTLLGYEYARKRLDGLGFDYIAFDDHHFLEDLQWKDAVPMFERLIKLSKEHGVEFGVKITNTFPVDVTRNELPSEEMYMAGRSLFPLSMHLARKISDTFDGKLRISYSGGAEARNIEEIFGAGIWPITMATNELKPGGYERFSQLAEILEKSGREPFGGVDLPKLHALDDEVEQSELYRKPLKPAPKRKLDDPLPLVDCFTAPCRYGCPINQDIPAYLLAVDEGRLEDALEIIVRRNALPHITGNLCPHPCNTKCERAYYESDGAAIRASKLTASHGAFETIIERLREREPEGKINRKVAIIGGGPAGLATAFFLTRAGAEATIFERNDRLGGVARHVIPEFRIPDIDIQHDIDICLSYGAKVELNTEVKSIDELKQKGFSDVVVCVGAWGPGSCRMDAGEELDVLEFMRAAKSDPNSVTIGEHPVIVGAGNTAMDAARVAMRMPGVKDVTMVYRRTRQYMPADEEELYFALEDGVEFLELMQPKVFDGEKLVCHKMVLGAPDASGRRAPQETEEEVILPCTAVISAVGERVEQTVYQSASVELNRRGVPASGCNTGVEGVWAAGDCRRGPATFVEAIADAQTVAHEIAQASLNDEVRKNVTLHALELLRARKGDLCLDRSKCGSRCLGCATICEVCQDVCPNRANVALKIDGFETDQIVHIDGMCNECGNCGVFCPWAGRPYKDKITVFWSSEDMDDSTNPGFVAVEGGYRVRIGENEGIYDIDNANCGLDEKVRQIILAVRDKYNYLLSGELVASK